MGRGGGGGSGGGGGVIVYNRMKFRSNPFSLSNVIESSWFSHRGRRSNSVLYWMKFRSNPFSLSKVSESSWFSHIHLKIKAHYEKRRPATGLRGLCLIHDNAPAHKCVLVQDFLKEANVVQLSHPPYSPDLCSCDFFLFPLLKKTLSGRRYESRSVLTW